ncbi:hypothetical protein NLN62_51660 (plasmid) [Bradyrhizobium sp. CCGUVB23]|nr:hypothetical protein [Bradyrhizobium sp. CCGUVB23]MCP3468528.1 hypothetical protein [Bradyrhizobium sp. CCGUVB23]
MPVLIPSRFDLSVYECLFRCRKAAPCMLSTMRWRWRKRHLDVTLINTVPSALAALLDKNAVPVSASVIFVRRAAEGRPHREGVREQSRREDQ